MEKKLFVLVFLFGPDLRTLLLVEKNRPDWMAGKYNGLGGKIEPGETPRAAALREVKEECNVELRDYELEGVEVFDHEEKNATIHVFAARTNLCCWRSLTDERVRCFDLPDLFDETEIFVENVQRLASKSACIVAR